MSLRSFMELPSLCEGSAYREIDSSTIPIFQMRKPRPPKASNLPNSHTAKMKQVRNAHQSWTPEPVVLNTVLPTLNPVACFKNPSRILFLTVPSKSE